MGSGRVGARTSWSRRNGDCARQPSASIRRPSTKAGDPPFDVAWTCSGILFVAEVKSTTRDNEEHQLRLGLGQLLRYRWQLGRQTSFPVKGILVPESGPSDPEWSALCESLGISLVPGRQIPDLLPSLVSSKARMHSVDRALRDKPNRHYPNGPKPADEGVKGRRSARWRTAGVDGGCNREGRTALHQVSARAHLA
jgi:hypothetical protein